MSSSCHFMIDPLYEIFIKSETTQYVKAMAYEKSAREYQGIYIKGKETNDDNEYNNRKIISISKNLEKVL